MDKEGIRNIVFREPGGTTLGERVRDILLHHSDLEISPIAEYLLFSASRSQLVVERVLPMLDSDFVVIIDRYFYSSIAYQGFGRGIPVSKIEYVNHFATQNVIPDVIFLIQLDIATALERRVKSGRGTDRMEKGEIDFFRKVIEGFDYCAKEEPNRFVIVDGKESPDDLSEQIFQNVMKRIEKVKKDAP